MKKKRKRTPAQKLAWEKYVARLARMLTISHERALRGASFPREEKKAAK
jgi:hypothetical protein